MPPMMVTAGKEKSLLNRIERKAEIYKARAIEGSSAQATESLTRNTDGHRTRETTSNAQCLFCSPSVNKSDMSKPAAKHWNHPRMLRWIRSGSIIRLNAPRNMQPNRNHLRTVRGAVNIRARAGMRQ